jgi:hypothetical protein
MKGGGRELSFVRGRHLFLSLPMKLLRPENPFSKRALGYDSVIRPKRIQMQLEGIPNFEEKYTEFYLAQKHRLSGMNLERDAATCRS